MAAAITVGLWRLPVSFCTISTGRSPLLTAHHRAQIGIKDVSSFYAVVHKSSHSAGI